jgi:Family of unknown function (DUF5681)
MANHVPTKTSWKPGQSGNPLGRMKKGKNLRELAREFTDDAINTIVSIMLNPQSSDVSRIAAARELLNRGWGVPQPLLADIGDMPHVHVYLGGDLTCDQWMAEVAPRCVTNYDIPDDVETDA